MSKETVFAAEDGSVHTRWVEDDTGPKVVREQYVGDIRDYCIARHNEGHHGHKDMKLMASFPQVVVDHYIAVTGITFQEFIRNPEHAKRMVNDPALADFRIAPGRM